MTSQVEVPPLTGLIHFFSGKRRVKTGTRFSLRDKQLFEISQVEIMRVDCTS